MVIKVIKSAMNGWMAWWAAIFNPWWGVGNIRRRAGCDVSPQHLCVATTVFDAIYCSSPQFQIKDEQSFYFARLSAFWPQAVQLIRVQYIKYYPLINDSGKSPAMTINYLSCFIRWGCTLNRMTHLDHTSRLSISST